MRSPRFRPILHLSLGLLAGCAPMAAAPAGPAAEVSPPPGMPVLEGTLMNQVTRLEKDLPRAATEGFTIPEDAEMTAFSDIPADLREGRLELALTSAQANAYELFWYTDRNDKGAVSYLLREADPSRKGWGVYAFRVATESSLIVEAPHPLADADTPSVSVAIYRDLNARALLIAGAHRDANRDGSADAAHDPQTVFQAIHESELRQSLSSTDSAIVLQIHGFAASSHPAYPQVIVSYEHGRDINPANLVQGQLIESAIVKALQQRGVEAGTCGGGQWRDLCGSTNIQASTMSQGLFIHLELDDSVRREDKQLRAALADALGVQP